MCLVHPNVMIDSHVIRDKGRVIERWEVRENDCGYRATTFIVEIVMKIRIRMMFCLLFFFRLKEISFLINREILFLIVVVGLVDVHVFRGVNVMIRMIMIQEIDRIEEDGSKIENRFVIILWTFVL